MTQGPYGIIGRLALWWYSKGDEDKPIPRNFDPNQPMPGLRIGDGIDRDNKMWYDRTLNAAPKVLMVAGFVLLGMVVPGPEDVFIGWSVSRGYTVVKSGTQFIIKIKGENRVLSETEVMRLIGQYREWVGRVRELEVEKLSGGKVTPHLVRKTRWGSVQIDVEVPGTAYISVGGPAKAADLAGLGFHLKKLKAAADEQNVRAMMYSKRALLKPWLI
ncbi:MAG: hypothetical protein N3E46_15035 [Gemmataceae bacterium]|uniref:Uncharacterized protein n=1 Tax=Thermogemmata fonticola TaxID=2755323 RepID=A0A7V8VFR4_9BACT|nr:hypothetical protein [Thermogemmata fonticola]MBA2227080.1 hypothetical protein [Thermogemmata fonticola]MCX8140986.1 hypothetical protein [Gemmataceae bacterium]